MQKTLGDKIKEILELKEMKQADLAKAAGLSTGVLSEICTNKRTSVTTETLKKIAKALDIHPAYFLEDDATGPKDLLSYLPEEERKFVIDSKNLPWIKLTAEAKKKGLSPDKVRQIIELMSE